MDTDDTQVVPPQEHHQQDFSMVMPDVPDESREDEIPPSQPRPKDTEPTQQEVRQLSFVSTQNL